MRVVMIVPTGIGCSIGGHAGDANPSAKLLSAASEELIVHPNVVNASDINEMRENVLYVEGSALDRFLWGDLALRRVQVGSNRILVLANGPAPIATRNAIGAARATIGADVDLLELDRPLVMSGGLDARGKATGSFGGTRELLRQVESSGKAFDAVAISTPIDVSEDLARRYLRTGGVNPWGAVEAMVSRRISECLGIPVAHAPIGGLIDETFDEVVVDARAAECVSRAYLHSVLKGLHRAPRLVRSEDSRPADLTVKDIHLLVSPWACWGAPHQACRAAGVEIVWVRENCPEIRINADLRNVTMVTSYLEAAGLIIARAAGVSTARLRISL